MRNLLVLVLALGLSSFSWAETSNEYDEGIEYEVIEKIQPAPEDGTVEVIEFFSYACPHCYRFEPHIEKWLESKPQNVTLKQVPAVFNKNWEAFASLYYAAEVLGVKDKMHPIIFKALHGDGKKIKSMEGLKEVFVANGVSAEELEQALNSFTVAGKTRRAKTMTEAYGITSVPNMVVQGKYRTNGTLAQGHENVFKVVDYLSEQVVKDAK
jgi:thiol:disulfide interchange protein DsbA